MEKLIRKNWWKLLGVLIVIYTFIAGFLVPLSPGIMNIGQGDGIAGESLEVNIQGYNTHFKDAEESMRVWLKLDNESAILAQSITTTSNVHAKAIFDVPPYLPVEDKRGVYAIIIDNEVDGAFVRPRSISLLQDTVDLALAEQVWINAEVDNLNHRENITFPFRNILEETIRNIYFHVSLWLAMMILFIAAAVYSIRYLRSGIIKNDYWASSLTVVGLMYGILGLLTGGIWAQYTWGEFWSWDVKQYTTLIALLIYLAYFVLRSSLPDAERKGRISSVYNIFAFAMLIPLLYVVPRLADSLHPGNGGNPALGSNDLDNTMRMVFYPAVIGWTLIACWIASIRYRILCLEEFDDMNE